MGKNSSFIKRLTDIIISLFVIILMSPIILIAIIAIRIETSGSALFLQDRAGLGGKPFKIFKLRTMVKNAEKVGPLLTQSNDSRVTKVGKILRMTSLDEFPQFINILKGEMSLVGPRPEVLPIVETYNESQRQVLNYKPGLTGISQINGRGSLSV
nr:sugar transferase [Ignavibacteriaceae bacterium]